MVIAFCNQKGGTSKTTSAAAFASALCSSGKKILCIDAAPQCNFTHLLATNEAPPGIIELLQGATVEKVIRNTPEADVIAGSERMAALLDIPPQTLAERIAPIKRRYKHIIIDTDCSLTTPLLLALFAADVVLIPVIADAGSLMGIQALKRTIDAARAAGAKVKIGGAFITQSNTRRTNAEKVLEDAMRQRCEALGISLYRQRIRRADAVRAAAALGESIITYDPKSNPAKDYMALLEEMNLL